MPRADSICSGVRAGVAMATALFLSMAAAVPGFVGVAEAQVNGRDGGSGAADTLVVTGPQLAQQRVRFSPVYLNRVLEAVRRKRVVSVEIEVPPELAHARIYARRYGISDELALQIIDSALEEGLDPDLGFRLIRVESVFKPNARGPAGSLGLTQLQPSTARAIDRSLRTEADILEPSANLRTGFKYLRRLLDRYDGDVRLALLAYNRGETAVDRALRAGRDPENGYSRKVLGATGSIYTGSGIAPES